MAAPTEVLSHGTAALYPLTDEPTGSPTILIEKITKKVSREHTYIKNVNQTDVRYKGLNPTLTLSFTGQLNATTGLAIAGPGATVTSVSNLSTTYRTIDPAVGAAYVLDFEDDVERINDAPMTKFDIVFKPFMT